MKHRALILGALAAGGAGLLISARPTQPAPGSHLSTAISTPPRNPLAHRAKPHLDHTAFFKEKIATGPEVTQKCLSCHPESAKEVMQTAHWTWLSGDAIRDGKSIPIGKKNLINNFCISVSGNWASCTKCHAGYGWTDDNFDFTRQENVDCLACHDGSGGYAKEKGGLPGKQVDLAAAAGSVRAPGRDNCGSCHFNGGGGMGVKHGDLDDSLLNPNEELDVHMGKLNFQCTDCHETHGHVVPGKMNATYSEASHPARFGCDKCHSGNPHKDAVLNKHLDRLACQTCHVPAFARKYPTKMDWDWSKAGDQARQDSTHEYLKIKGEFRYDGEVRPEYAWYNGKMDRYLMGDPVTSDDQAMNQPLGGRDDPKAKLWPFKIHRAKQIWDPINKILIPPITSGEGGYWTQFDWAAAAKKGMATAGLPYSGEFDFTKTHMYWPITHMVAPAKEALVCQDCHGPKGRLDWKALGYQRDPAGGIRYED